MLRPQGNPSIGHERHVHAKIDAFEVTQEA